VDTVPVLTTEFLIFYVKYLAQ